MNKSTIKKLFEDNGAGTWTDALTKHAYNHAITCANKNGIISAWSNEQFTALYSSFCFYIISNMEKIVLALNSSKLNINDVCTTDITEIDPDIYKNEKNTIALKLEQKIEERYSNRYACPKCKMHKIKIEERQTAALDEISKFFKICCNPTCRFKWS